MKRIIGIALVMGLLCACSQQNSDVRTFSYAQDCIDYHEYIENAVRPDPEGQKFVLLMTPAKAVEIAKKYCTFGNAEASVDYDSETDMYRVTFIQAIPMDGYVVYSTGGVTVYLDGDGIVLMVTYGE